MELRNICVFCGSNKGKKNIYTETAAELGKQFAANHIRMIFGGGKVGLMGAMADSILLHGGKATGVITHFLADKELAHKAVEDMIFVDTMQQRKAKMAELSDAFIALPGGFGTLEELFEIMTSAQLGFHKKPIGILDIDHYYEPLFELFEKMVKEKFLRPMHRDMILFSPYPVYLLDKLKNFSPPDNQKWIDEFKMKLE